MHITKRNNTRPEFIGLLTVASVNKPIEKTAINKEWPIYNFPVLTCTQMAAYADFFGRAIHSSQSHHQSVAR